MGVCLLISLVIAYITGAIPTGYWLGKIVGGIDITQHGSGNIGATNIARVLGKKYFALVFLIDAGKAWATLYCCDNFLLQNLPNSIHVAMLLITACVLLMGNAYSCFIGFRGGKGVAAMVGIIGYVYPPILLLIFCFSWLLVLLITRRVFAASLIAIVAMSLAALWLTIFDIKHFLFLAFMCVWLIVRHHDNIKKWWASRDS